MGYFIQTDVRRQVDRDLGGRDVLLQGDQGFVQRFASSPLVQLDGPGGEQQAEDVAPPAPAASAADGGAQMTPTPVGQGQNEAAPEGDANVAMSRSGGGAPSNTVRLSSYLGQTAGRGSRMGGTVLRSMSSAFGYNFGGVSVHNDSASHNVCRSLGANAFATGNDVYFAAGKYNPGSASGDRLIAHELTHVVQQNGGTVARSVQGSGIRFSSPGDAHEVEADRVGDIVARSLHDGGGSTGGANLNRSASGTGGSLPTLSLADAIIQRKIAGVPDVQMDVGTTVGIVLGVVGIAVSVASWAATGGGGAAAINPRLEWLAARNADRDRYRTANPWRTASMPLLVEQRLGSSWNPKNFRYGVNLTWRYNGAELTEPRLAFTSGTENPTFGSANTQLEMWDNQSQGGRLGLHLSSQVDPVGNGYYTVAGVRGWIGVDGGYHRDNYQFTSH